MITPTGGTHLAERGQLRVALLIGVWALVIGCPVTVEAEENDTENACGSHVRVVARKTCQ